MKVANERVRVFIAKYKYGQHPTPAHQKLHTLTRHDEGIKFDLKIATLTAGCLAMQVIAVRSVGTGELVYATSELGIELLGEAKRKIDQIWPPTNNAVRWSDLAPMSQQDIEDWTDRHVGEGAGAAQLWLRPRDGAVSIALVQANGEQY